MFIAKKLADFRVRGVYNADYEIETAENTSVALRRVGLYLGIAIAMFGALSTGNTNGFEKDLVAQLVDGSLIIIFLAVAMYINDKILLSGIDNTQALKDNNISVGLVEMGAYIGTGLIAYGSFAGTGPWYSSIVFFILGQIMLIAMVKVYEYFSSYDALEEIKNGNIPAGLMVGGTMVAYGLILKASIMGPFNGWEQDLIGFGISAFSGIVLLVLVNMGIDKLFLPNTNVHKEIKIDRDLPPIMVVVAVKIAIALTISAVVL
jgi:uncharacterized membrane protein YjfL (UPF0719 family)